MLSVEQTAMTFSVNGSAEGVSFRHWHRIAVRTEAGSLGRESRTEPLQKKQNPIYIATECVERGVRYSTTKTLQEFRLWVFGVRNLVLL
jgi:hypothetical protein